MPWGFRYIGPPFGSVSVRTLQRKYRFGISLYSAVGFTVLAAAVWSLLISRQTSGKSPGRNWSESTRATLTRSESSVRRVPSTAFVRDAALNMFIFGQIRTTAVVVANTNKIHGVSACCCSSEDLSLEHYAAAIGVLDGSCCFSPSWTRRSRSSYGAHPFFNVEACRVILAGVACC